MLTSLFGWFMRDPMRPTDLVETHNLPSCTIVANDNNLCIPTPEYQVISLLNAYSSASVLENFTNQCTPDNAYTSCMPSYSTCTIGISYSVNSNG